MPITSTRFEVNPENEFFLAIGMQGIHSFLMLGVRLDDGAPQLIARVGKTNDVDADFENNLLLFTKELGEGSMARLADERIFRSSDKSCDINYQAYTLTFKQVKDFLAIIKKIEQNQLEDPILSKAIEDIGTRNLEKIRKMISIEETNESFFRGDRIRCFIPSQQSENEPIVFNYKKLEETTSQELPELELEREIEPMATQAKKTHVLNTCRTTALAIIERVLGFKSHVSEHFFIAPEYATKLVQGNPDGSTFYIHPVPPLLKPVEESRYTKVQLKTLQKLYQRLLEIPKTEPGSNATKNKFNELKKMYTELVGNRALSAVELLECITKYDESKLYEVRELNLISRQFKFKSATQKLIEEIKEELKKGRPLP